MKDLIRKILKEDFDWTDSTQPETEWDKDKYYVLDVTSLSGLRLQETIDDIWDFAYNIDYDVEVGVDYGSVGYVYFEPTDEVPEGYALDWSNRNTEDPTFGGKYQMLSLVEFYHMAYGDEPSINESLDWVGDVNPLKHGYYYIDARDLSREERIELQKKLLNLGFRWGDSSSAGPDQINLWALNTLVAYSIDGTKNRIYYAMKPYDKDTKRWLKYLSYDDFLELINENINENFDWVKDTEPSVNDIKKFNKQEFPSTVDYNTVEIGDSFIPPNSHKIWTVIDKEEMRRSGDFTIWIRNDSVTKRVIWRESDKTFPSFYRPWRKVI